MATRTYYSDKETEAIIEARSGTGDKGAGDRSGAIRRGLSRYAEICRRSQPKLSVAEWNLVCDSLSGVIHDSAGMVAALSIGIADSIRLDGLDAKWKVDGPALVAKLEALSYCERVAVVDLAERYWIVVGKGERPLVPGESE